MSVLCTSCKSEGIEGMVFCPSCGQLLHVTDPFADRVVGKYRLLERIGDGGSSIVYRANHIEDGRSFAVKILLPQYTNKQDMVGRFHREAQVMSRLEHENVVCISDFGRVAELGFYIAMEWLEGETVRSYLQRKGPLPKELVLYLFAQISEVLGIAHDNGIVHRDLKLENLMLVQGSQGQTILKVLDFGVAHVSHVDKSLTDTGILVGTPRYMAPEQIRAEKGTIDARTDVYACGLMLLEMLTGQSAFQKETVSQLLYGQLHEMPPYLHQLHPDGDFGGSLEIVVRRAVQKKPEQRYPSVQEFQRALQKSMWEEGIYTPDQMQLSLQFHQVEGTETTRECRRASNQSEKLRHSTPQSFMSHGSIPDSSLPRATPRRRTMAYSSMASPSLPSPSLSYGSTYSHSSSLYVPASSPSALHAFMSQTSALQGVVEHSPLPRQTMSLGEFIEADHRTPRYSEGAPEPTVAKRKTEPPWSSQSGMASEPTVLEQPTVGSSWEHSDGKEGCFALSQGGADVLANSYRDPLAAYMTPSLEEKSAHWGDRSVGAMACEEEQQRALEQEEPFFSEQADFGVSFDDWKASEAKQAEHFPVLRFVAEAFEGAASETKTPETKVSEVDLVVGERAVSKGMEGGEKPLLFAHPNTEWVTHPKLETPQVKVLVEGVLSEETENGEKPLLFAHPNAEWLQTLSASEQELLSSAVVPSNSKEKVKRLVDDESNEQQKTSERLFIPKKLLILWVGFVVLVLVAGCSYFLL